MGRWTPEARSDLTGTPPGPPCVTWLYFKRKWSTMGIKESSMSQRMTFLWLRVRSWMGTSRQGPAGARSRVHTCSSCTVLRGTQETGEEHGLAQVLCPAFPLPDQHWSDDGPSDAETELCRQHQAEVEVELLRISENEKQPPSTPWRHERGQSLS